MSEELISSSFQVIETKEKKDFSIWIKKLEDSIVDESMIRNILMFDEEFSRHEILEFLVSI